MSAGTTPRPPRGPGARPPAARRTRRVRVRLWTFVPMVLVVLTSLVVGLWMVLLPLDASRAVDRYSHGDVDDAAAMFARQQRVPALVAWQADFNRGTALLATVDPDGLASDAGADVGTVSEAAALLDAARTAAADGAQPPAVICMVSTNAAIAHERLAAAEEADERFAAAADDYELAATLRANPACGEAGLRGRQERNDEAAQEDLRRAAQARASASRPEPRPSPSPEADPAERDRQAELNRLAEEATRALDEEQQSQTSDGEGEAPASDTAKGW